SADRPGDVLAPDLQGAAVAVVVEKVVEVPSGERHPLREGLLGEQLTGGEAVGGLAHQPEVAEHPAGDHHPVDPAALDLRGDATHVHGVAAADHRDVDRLLDPGDLVPVGVPRIALAAGAPVHGDHGDAHVLEGPGELGCVD